MQPMKTGPPMVFLSATLAVALASVGLAYGLWSKNLTIEGTVETGRVDARWLGGICNEFHSWPDLPRGPQDIGEAEGKDVGSWSLIIDEDDDQILHFTIYNGYPSYAVDCEVHFQNDGSVPWIVRGTTIVPVLNLTNCILTGNQTKTLKCDQLTVKYFDGIGAQVDPGDGMASSLVVHVEQPADQNATYKFDVKLCLGQWNEPATSAECFAAAP